MQKRYLKSYITRYTNQVKTTKSKADYFYRRYHETKSSDDYMQSQYYYEKCKEAKEILENYRNMLRNGEYEE